MLMPEAAKFEDFRVARTGAAEVTPAPKPPSEPPLYASRVKVYPKEAHGRFRTVKWIVMAVTLGIYYLVPWIRWDRGPYLPDQAVLIDFPSRRFYFFFLEIWPQEFYYITGLLVLAALALFLVTSIAGRVWCGYTCPQTVWTDLMIAVERFWQGDRNQRLRLDKAPWSAETLSRKGATHLTWLLIAIATGGAWVFYFADAPTLARQLVTFDAPLTAYLFIGIFTATTYVLGGTRAGAGLHLYVPLAAHPGRDVRPRLAADHLSRLARRAARAAQGGTELGGARRLHRLQSMRGCLSHGN